MRPGKKQGQEVPVAVSQNSRKQPVSPAALNPQPQQRSHTLRSRVLTPTAPRVLKTENQLAPRPRREEVSGGRRHSGSVGGRGSRRAPECSTELRLSRSFALPLWPTSRAPAPRRLPAAPPLPHGRGSWLTAWCGIARCDVHCCSKTQNPPLAPVKRGRGVGGEGARPPGKRTPGGEKIRSRCSGWKARATKKIANRRAGCTAGMTRTACRALQLSHPKTTVCGSPDTSSGKNSQAAGRAGGGHFTPHPATTTAPSTRHSSIAQQMKVSSKDAKITASNAALTTDH